MLNRRSLLLISAVILTIGIRMWSGTQPTRASDGFDVRFSSTAVELPCVCDGVRRGGGDGRVRLQVVADSDAPLNYKYSVTGGRIVGKGPEVVWDFNDNFAPGDYSITVSVDDGLGAYSRTLTRSITVAEACCLCPCVCPSMAVVSPHSQVKRGGKLDFEARISGSTAKEIKYFWRIENGVITSGQGTPSIEVTASSETMADTVTATVEVGLDIDCSCPNVADQAVPIGPRSITRRFPASVTWLELDESTITLACQPSYAPVRGKQPSSKDTIIDVATHAESNSRNDKLDYTYSVTGGRIIGSGQSVKWDVTNLAPGIYNITVFVDDGRGKSEEKTRTITVVEQDCGGHVDCPLVSLSTPQRIGTTSDFIVRASVSGTFTDGQYVWDANGSQLIAGQGSNVARVRAASMKPSEPGPLVNFTFALAPEFSFCNQSSSVHLWIPSP